MVAAVAGAAHRIMIGVYLHIPFCAKLCPYCDFVKRKARGADYDAFTQAIIAEIESFDGPSEAGSIFFGGGTPSLLPPSRLGRIMDALNRRFALIEPEVTLETNPDDVTPDRLKAWRGMGVNRISLGVQSFADEVLAYLGRNHDARQAHQACGETAACFDNWGVDLIFGARPPEHWPDTLAETARWDPPHISAYGLTYEAGTPFAKRTGEAVEDEEYVAQYRMAEEVFSRHARYEVSNFARPGYESAHNLIYWRNHEYAGFGPGAYAYIGGVRSRNLSSLRGYLAAPGRKTEALPLTPREIRLETVIQHLRLRQGLDKRAYAERFGAPVSMDFGETLDALLKRGLITDEDGWLRPTRKGFELNNEIGLALVG